MTTSPPTVYILHGEDDQAIAEFLMQIRSKLGDPATADMNTIQLETKGLILPDLQNACLTAPFLARRRLVILDNYFSSAPSRKNSRAEEPGSGGNSESSPSGKESQHEFFELLESIPVSTALVLVEKKTLSAGHPLLKWAVGHTNLAYVREFAAPKAAALPQWIIARAKAEGGAFSPEAAQMLAFVAGEDPRVLAQEIIKLLTYVGPGRAVSPEDVRSLTPESAQTSIFDMVDAIGGRNKSRAQGFLRKILDQEESAGVFGMIVRQFRMLLLARESLDAGTPAAQLPSTLGIHPFVARKVAAQAGGFTLGQLEKIYRQLRDIDENVKLGRAEMDTALELFVIEMCQ